MVTILYEEPAIDFNPSLFIAHRVFYLNDSEVLLLSEDVKRFCTEVWCHYDFKESFIELFSCGRIYRKVHCHNAPEDGNGVAFKGF